MFGTITEAIKQIKLGLNQPNRNLTSYLPELGSNSLPLIAIKEIFEKLDNLSTFLEILSEDEGDYNSLLGQIEYKLTYYGRVSDERWRFDLMYLDGLPITNFVNYLNELECVKYRFQIDKILKFNEIADLKSDVDDFKSIYSMIKENEPFLKEAQKLSFELDNWEFDMSKQRSKVESEYDEFNKITNNIQKLELNAIAYLGSISKIEVKAKDVLRSCQEAFSASTTVGLAKSFSSKAFQLQGIMAFWVIVLFTTLCYGINFGTTRLDTLLSELEVVTKVSETTAYSVQTINWPLVAIKLILVIISFGGTIWAAWLATKQIGMYFRLSEDYGYKSALAKAYSGYKSEAERIDQSLYNKLFNIALDRLDESPIRLIDEKDDKNSPIQEFLESKMFTRIIEIAPQLKDDLIELLKSYGKKNIEQKAEKKE